MSKQLLREYYELCEGGVCKDLLNEEEKRYVAAGGMPPAPPPSIGALAGSNRYEISNL